MTNQGRAQFWFGLAIIFASVVGGICSLFGPAYGICAAVVVFVIVLVIGGMCCIQPPEN